MDAHFENEERLMDRYGYPGTADHKAEHRQACRDVESMVRLLAVLGFDIRTLVQPLERRIKTHMCDVDARFAEFLYTQNVEPCDSDTGVFGEADSQIPETPGSK